MSRVSELQRRSSQSFRRWLAPSVLWADKVPEYESNQWKQNHDDNPEQLFDALGTTLQDFYDCPDVGDQNQQTDQTLVLHVYPPWICIDCQHTEPVMPSLYYKMLPAKLNNVTAGQRDTGGGLRPWFWYGCGSVSPMVGAPATQTRR